MTAAFDEWPAGTLAERLRAFAKTNALPQHAGSELDDLIAEAAEVEQNADTFARAAHMLHEQAHGASPWLVCQAEPCRSIPHSDEDRGPAPLTLL